MGLFPLYFCNVSSYKTDFIFNTLIHISEYMIMCFLAGSMDGDEKMQKKKDLT